MGARSTGNLPAELEIGRRQFEQWRERRKFRSPDIAAEVPGFSRVAVGGMRRNS